MSQSSPFCAAEQVLYKFQERFIDNVDADSIVKELKRKHIISDYVSDGINSFSNPMYQSQFLHAQLVKRCTAEALRDVCDILVSVEGNPKMRSLGKDMKKMLQGKCRWCVHVYMSLIVCLSMDL